MNVNMVSERPPAASRLSPFASGTLEFGHFLTSEAEQRPVILWNSSSISHQHSAIADLEHPSALSLSFDKAIDSAERKRIFQIGDC